MSTCLPKRAAKAGSSRASSARAPGVGLEDQVAGGEQRPRPPKPELARERPQVGHHHPPSARRARCCRAARPRSGSSRPRRPVQPGSVAADEVARRRRCRRPARSSKRSASRLRTSAMTSAASSAGDAERARAPRSPSASAEFEGLAHLEVHPGMRPAAARAARSKARASTGTSGNSALHELDDPDRRLLVVDADHDHARLGRAGRVQDVEPRPVAVVDLEAEVGRRLGSSRVSVSMMLIVEAARQQRLADDLPHPAEADDERVAVQPVRPPPPRPSHGGGSRRQPVVQDHHERRQRHRDDDDRGQDGVLLGGRAGPTATAAP